MSLATVMERLAYPNESSPEIILKPTMHSTSANQDWSSLHLHPANTAGTKSIGYSPELVPTLIEDHRRILQLFADIGIACLRSNGSTIVPCLLEFSRALTNHQVTENSRLYVYMKRSMAADEVNKTRINTFRKEMIAVTNSVSAFIDRYRSVAAWSPELLEAFKNDLMWVGELLVTRIESEESELFAIYQPVDFHLEN